MINTLLLSIDGISKAHMRKAALEYYLHDISNAIFLSSL